MLTSSARRLVNSAVEAWRRQAMTGYYVPPTWRRDHPPRKFTVTHVLIDPRHPGSTVTQTRPATSRDRILVMRGLPVSENYRGIKHDGIIYTAVYHLAVLYTSLFHQLMVAYTKETHLTK